MARRSIGRTVGGLALLAAGAIGVQGFAASSSTYFTPAVLPQPRPFAPEAITGRVGVDCLTLTPDGDTAAVDIEGSHGSTIAISRRTADGWSPPQTAPFSGRWVDHDPAIAPDESFIEFDANYAGKAEPDHLYVAFADGNHWSSPVDLGDTVDRYQPWGAHLGPDAHTLYFTSNVATGPTAGTANHIWSMDLSPWLRTRPAAAAAMPSVFGAGVISGPANDAAATFTPDGKTVYFFRSNGQDYDIMTSHLNGARWSQPVIASFSGHWRDLEPAMAPDGSYLIFASSRPIDGSSRPIDGHWGGQLHAGRGGHLWRVNRRGDGWGAPMLLPESVNRFDSTFSPAIATDGSLYFMAATGPGGRFQLYYSQFKDGQYRTAVLLPFSAGEYGGVDPAVAPDQSFIVFGSNRPPTPAHDSYAFIAFRTDGHWGDPVPLPPAINSLGGIDELRLGPDGHTLYLTSNHVVPPDYPKTSPASVIGLRQMQSWNDGQDNIWVVDLAPWLERPHHPEP